MRKNIIVVLAFLLIVFTALPIYANEKPLVSLVENNIVNSDEDFDIDFDTDLTYYTFIYDHTNQWEVDDVIGQSNCVDGYLYTKNFNTGVIRQLVNVPIESFYEKDNKVFFPYDNGIYCVDYLGLQLTEIYRTNKTISEKVIQVNGEKIYFVLDDKLVRYNETDRSLEYLFEASGMTDLFIKSENEYIYLVGKQMHYVCLNNNYNEGCIELNSINSNSSYNNIVIDDVQLMNSLLSEQVVNDESDASINSSTVTYQKDYNLTSIMSDYPSGSYFTYDGGACYHHGTGCSYSGGCNCKYYDYAIQCMGFAKYASDRYAHKSSWNPPSTEQYEPNKHFNSANQIRHILIV